MPTLLTKINMTMPIVTLLDVGVNIGQTYIKFKQINQSAKYIGFEPNPVCYDYSKKLLELNNDQNSILVPVGLGEKSGLISFYASTQASSDGTMIEQLRINNANITKQIIPVFRFDDIYGDFDLSGNIVIKIDVEGAELNVIQGMHNFILEKQPIIICEVLHADAQEKQDFNKKRNDELVEILRKLDYVIYKIIKDFSVADFSGITVVTRFSEGIWDPINSPAECDYIFAPSKIVLDFLN
jgi:FkbM family methyltransferase